MVGKKKKKMTYFSKMRRSKQKLSRASIVIPLHFYGDPTGPTVHVTGIDYRIGPYVGTDGLMDSGSSMPAISTQTAKIIQFQNFPLVAPIHSPSDPGIRQLPIEIPDAGIFHIPFLVGFDVQPTLIPPDIFYPWYDVEFTPNQYMILKAKSYHPVIPYIQKQQSGKSIVVPGKKMPIIPFSVGNVSFPGTLDTGDHINELTRQTADLLGIGAHARVPVSIAGTGLVLEMVLKVTGTHYNVISAEQLLRRGFHIIFTNEGIRIQ